MLIDAIDVRQVDTRNPGKRASGDVPWPAPYSGRCIRRSRGIETPAVTEDAIRLSLELHRIVADLYFHGDDAEAHHSGPAVLISPEQSSECAGTSRDLAAAATPERTGRAQLESRLWWAFESEPLEDGMDHPAERLLAEHLNQCPAARLLEWISGWCTDSTNAAFAASVFQCLARQTRPGTASWRTGLVQSGLAAPHVEIRDAAAKAADSWRDSELLSILERHMEPVPWLADFIRDVVTDWD